MLLLHIPFHVYLKCFILLYADSINTDKSLRFFFFISSMLSVPSGVILPQSDFSLGTNNCFSSRCWLFAWKRLQVVSTSAKRAGIIGGCGWPYDGVRCSWRVWQLTFVVGRFLPREVVRCWTVCYCTSSMSQLRGAVFDRLLHLFYQNLSADTQTCRDEEKSLFYDQDLRIEVSCIEDCYFNII